MSAENKAVFLSYASQDAEAARRICDALRGAGLEVWFDQSELRGGDSWDAKIRQQIKECALFMPIISANTQARLEGYFRLEWKLAAQRTHTMAEEKPFLLPVVIDATRDADGKVPAEFRVVQWMQVPQGEAPHALCARVQKLLDPRDVGPSAAAAVDTKQPGATARPVPLKVGRAPRARLAWTLAAASVVLIGFFGWKLSRRTEIPTATELAARRSAPPTSEKAVASAPATADKSIAVLPFENLSDDKENTAFFSDGMHEDILTNLANIRDLRVVSRTSVMEYRGTTKKIPQIARELGVAYILEGSVRRAGNQVRITGQLIRGASDEHLWAKSYDRDLTPKEMFAVQASLSTEIARALHAVISPETKKRVERRPTENLAAYDLYLKSRALGNSGRAALREQEKLLQAAVGLDPNFAEAWGELAVVHARHVSMGCDRAPRRLADADAAIARAVRLAPDEPDIIRLLGRYADLGYRDYDRAVAQFEKVIRLQPNNAEVFLNLGLVQSRQGRWVESLASFRKALELEPGNTNHAFFLTNHLLRGRRWDEALAVQRRLQSSLPENVSVQTRLAEIAFYATGSTKEIDDWLARQTPAELATPRMIPLLKYWANLKGNYSEWKRLDRVKTDTGESELARRSQVIDAALILAANGDIASARARLEQFSAKVKSALGLDPADSALWRDLSVIEALFGLKEEALRDARKAVELNPEVLNTVFGPSLRLNLAVVYAWTGDKDAAIAELARLLGIPAGVPAGVHALRVDVAFAPLRGDPRFEALLRDPKNHAPLF